MSCRRQSFSAICCSLDAPTQLTPLSRHKLLINQLCFWRWHIDDRKAVSGILPNPASRLFMKYLAALLFIPAFVARLSLGSVKFTFAHFGRNDFPIAWCVLGAGQQ
jgi:hypothetical protein